MRPQGAGHTRFASTATAAGPSSELRSRLPPGISALTLVSVFDGTAHHRVPHLSLPRPAQGAEMPINMVDGASGQLAVRR
jgi:hypothetical protein